MASPIRVRNLTRSPLRIGPTGVPVVGPTGVATSVEVDLDNPTVRRDLSRTFPRWVLESQLNSSNQEILNGSPLTGTFRENMSRTDITTDAATAWGATGVMTCCAVPVQGGDVITNINFVSGATAAVALTHQVASLYTAPLANAVQSLTINATGGTFTITYSAQTTAAIAWNATPAAVQSALWLISSINPGNVIVTGTPATATSVGTYTLTFSGVLSGQAITTVTTTATSLTGGAGTATPAAVTAGSPSQLIGYSTDVTSSAWAANQPKTFVLANASTGYTIPYTVPDDGIVYATIFMTKTTTFPSLVCNTLPLVSTAIGYPSGTSSQTVVPLCIASGSALTTAPPATIAAGYAGWAVVPYCYLS